PRGRLSRPPSFPTCATSASWSIRTSTSSTSPAPRRLDTLIVVGGNGLLAGRRPEPLIALLRRSARAARRVASVCTGAPSCASMASLRKRSGAPESRVDDTMRLRYARFDAAANGAPMKHLTTFLVTLATVLLSMGAAAAGDFGTAQEARALLDRAVAAMKQDKDAAIASFNRADGGFRDRDLYPFCATLDGITTAHPTHVGTNLRELKDKRGKAFGAEMFDV